jgi:hypothetical protein
MKTKYKPYSSRYKYLGFLFLSTNGKDILSQTKKTKRHYRLVVEFANGMTRTVDVKARDRETAEKRALKFHPNATGVKPNA